MTQTPTKVCKRCRAEVTGEYTSCPYDGWQLDDIPPDPLVGKIFNGKYEMQSILGKGGMSVVYKARDVFMERTVAIKILHTHLVADNSSIQRFQQEAQAAGSLNHPNIITVYDFGLTPDEQAFLIMECFEGPTLAEVLDDQTRIPAERANRLMRQICDGLEHAHKKGIVHRDLKPSNLCLVKDEQGVETVKIVDFGIAKLLPQEGQQRQQLTQTGQIFGSPLFMSPEQCGGKPIDSRSDLYSLGCLMYEALTGVPPFMGPTAFDTMTMHITEPPKPLKKSAPDVDIPQELEKPIMRCLEKNPDKRYQTAADVKADLPPLPESLPVGQTEWKPSWYGSIKHNPVAQMIIIAFFLLVVPFALFFTMWNGYPADKGTLLQRTIWGWRMDDAKNAIAAGDYNKARHILDETEIFTRKFFNNPSKLQDTLRLQAVLGSLPGLPSDPEWEDYARNANADLSAILDQQVEQSAEVEDFLLGAMEKQKARMKNDLNSSTPAVRSKALLDVQSTKNVVEGHSQRTINVARELAARGKFLEEQQLLAHALRVYETILGPDSVQVADIKLILAECNLQMQNVPPVRELLKSAYEIYLKHPKDDETAMVEAGLKLGQFERDQNQFAIAERYLKDGLIQARALYKKVPEENTNLLIESLRGYANLQAQAKKPAEADALYKEAAKYYAEAEARMKPKTGPLLLEKPAAETLMQLQGNNQ